MAAYLALDDVKSLNEKVDERSANLFRAKPNIPQLQVIDTENKKNTDGKDSVLVQFQSIKDVSEIKQLRARDTTSLVFFVRQDRSWTTLNISRDLFQGLVDEYQVFPQFWKCMFTFGRKDHENEFDFPEFRARRTLYDCASEMQESAYMLRRVELHGRELAEGQSPWSIRQTGIYHKLRVNSSPDGKSQASNSAFIMIAPSPKSEGQLQACFEVGSQVVQAWNVHRMLVADSMRNWMDYMAHLEEKLKEQSDPILLAKVGSGKENLEPLMDFHLKFGDRQELKDLEDQILNLQVILSTMFKTITRIRDHCRRSCLGLRMSDMEKRYLDMILSEFDEYIQEAETCLERARFLQKKAYSTTQLLSDLLSYEEAVALKDLTRETQLESKSMHHLTERSTKDAAAVKILTVITLIYLPTTIVANFFSTEFVQTDNEGVMRLSNNAWLLAAIAIPLTILTIALWGTWVYFTKVAPSPEGERPNTVPAILRRRQSSFKSMLSSRKSKVSVPSTPLRKGFSSIFPITKSMHSKDLETGIQTAPPPPSFATTWSSTATTVKFG